MSNHTKVEARLTALEEAVVDMQHRLASRTVASHWLDKVIGSISDEAAFLQALEYGRNFREADRPSDASGEHP